MKKFGAIVEVTMLLCSGVAMGLAFWLMNDTLVKSIGCFILAVGLIFIFFLIRSINDEARAEALSLKRRNWPWK